MGAHGRLLEEPEAPIGARLDYSFFNLERGSEFRTYCDTYAAFMQQYKGQVNFCANVDVIGNPDLTWQVQRYFEQEHGLRPIPVVHFGESMRYLERYLEKDYHMIGLGGFARRPDRNEVIKWLDDAFLRICPASNGYFPITKVHGFAMTSWGLLARWPWFSVDSTSWICHGSYGIILVPHYNEKLECWRYDRPPMAVSVSHRGRPIDYKSRVHISQPHAESRQMRETTMRWIKYLGLNLGLADADGEELEPGPGPDSEVRKEMNLRYYMELANSLPLWPAPLDKGLVRSHLVDHHRGMGLIHPIEEAAPSTINPEDKTHNTREMKKRHLRIYFSGWTGEHVPPGTDEKPCFMLTFYELREKTKKPTRLLEEFLERKRQRIKNRNK